MKELSEAIENARKLRQEMATAQSEAAEGNVVRTPLPLNNVQVHSNPSVIHSGFLRHRHPPWPWRTRYFELHESRRLVCFESDDGKKEPLLVLSIETMELVLSRDKLSGFMLQDARNTYHYECRSDPELRDWLFVLAYELEGVYLDAKTHIKNSRAKTIAAAGMPQRGGGSALSGRGTAATVDEDELAAVCLPSLLGDSPIEKGEDDPDSIQVGVVTWNMNEKLPSVADLGLVLREIASKSSIVAVCTQECKSVGLMMNGFNGQPAEWESKCLFLFGGGCCRQLLPVCGRPPHQPTDPPPHQSTPSALRGAPQTGRARAAGIRPNGSDPHFYFCPRASFLRRELRGDLFRTVRLRRRHVQQRRGSRHLQGVWHHFLLPQQPFRRPPAESIETARRLSTDQRRDVFRA